MVDRDPIERWSFDRITLIGDAAHAMRPNGSNGASQGILGTVALADALQDERDVATALKTYEAARLGPTRALTLANRETGPEIVFANGRATLSKRFRRYPRSFHRRGAARHRRFLQADRGLQPSSGLRSLAVTDIWHKRPTPEWFERHSPQHRVRVARHPDH